MPTTLGIDIGLVNFSYCVVREKDGCITIPDWKVINLLDMMGFVAGFPCAKVTPVDLHNIVDFVLPTIFGVDFFQSYNVQHVAIEQQPHGKYGHIRMIALSHLIFSHFRRMVFGATNSVLSVVMVSAACKYQKAFLDKFGFEKQKQYNRRKNLGVDIAMGLCKELAIPTTLIEDAPKKDDLADSFLLAYAELLKWL